MAGALDISHQQASTQSVGGTTFGAFNFNPGKAFDTKQILIIGAFAVVILLVLKKRR